MSPTTTPEQELAAAQQRVEAAQQAYQTAVDEQQRVLSNPETAYEHGERAQAAVRAATTALNNARQDYRNAQTRRDRRDAEDRRANKPSQENPSQKGIREMRERNLLNGHGYKTDKERDDFIASQTPKPPRPDSPAQQQQANAATQNAETNTTRAAETIRNNQQKNQQELIDAQIRALQNAGTLAQNFRQQVSTEAQNTYNGEIRQMEAGATAANNLMENILTQRGQDTNVQQARMRFIGDVLTTAMPRVAELMANTPKGSPVARNFLTTFLALANESYANAGLGVDLPGLDPNSAAYQNLNELAGRTRDMPPPRMPSANEIGMTAAIQMSGAGIPPIGWQGPIGVGAYQVDPPKPGQMGDGSNPYNDVVQSAEGNALRQSTKEKAAPYEAKIRDGTATPEDRAALASIKAEYHGQIDRLVQARQQQRQQQPATPNPSNVQSQAVKAQLRTNLITGNPTEKFNTIALINTAVANRAAGKPLDEAQIAILANIDQEDISIIQAQVTPEVLAAMQKPAIMRTQQDIELINGSMTNITEGIKARQMPPPTPEQVSAAERRPPPEIPQTQGVRSSQQISPEGIAAAEQESLGAQRDAEAERRQLMARLGGNPDAIAMYNQVKSERDARNAQQRADGQFDGAWGSDKEDVDEAIRRIGAGNKPDPRFYEQPGRANTASGVPQNILDQQRATGQPSSIYNTVYQDQDPMTTLQTNRASSVDDEMPKSIIPPWMQEADTTPMQPQPNQFRDQIRAEYPQITQQHVEEEIPRLQPMFPDPEEEEEERRRRQGSSQNVFSGSTIGGFGF